FRSQADCLQMEHIRDDAVALGDVALDGVGQSVHAGGGGQALGHGSHHVGVHHGDLGDVVGVHADELALLFHVGDDVVDGDLGGRAGGGGHGDGEHRMLFGGGHALQAAHIGKLGVIDDDADGLGGVHGGAAANGHDAVGAGRPESGHAVLDVLDGGVGLDLAVNAVGEARRVHQGGHFAGDAELDQVGVRADEGPGVAPGGQLGDDVLDRAVPMVGNAVQNNAVSHNDYAPFHFFRQAGTPRRRFVWFYHSTLLAKKEPGTVSVRDARRRALQIQKVLAVVDPEELGQLLHLAVPDGDRKSG